MSLSSCLGRRANFCDMPSPLDVVVTLFDNAPASSLARDAHAVANTSVDWKETASEHVLKADMPGLRKEDVRVQVEDWRTLSISGRRSPEEVHKTDTWHRVERSSGQFMRKFRLPENANLDGITAKVEHGVLTVVLPKVGPKTRSVAIAGHDGGSEAMAVIGPEVKVGGASPAASSDAEYGSESFMHV